MLGDSTGYIYSFTLGFWYGLVIFSVWHETEHLLGHTFVLCSVKQNLKYQSH